MTYCYDYWISEILKSTFKRSEPFGRPKGTGKFKESTLVVSVPDSQKPVILDFLEAYKNKRNTNTDLASSLDTSILRLICSFFRLLKKDSATALS